MTTKMNKIDLDKLKELIENIDIKKMNKKDLQKFKELMENISIITEFMSNGNYEQLFELVLAFTDSYGMGYKEYEEIRDLCMDFIFEGETVYLYNLIRFVSDYMLNGTDIVAMFDDLNDFAITFNELSNEMVGDRLGKNFNERMYCIEATMGFIDAIVQMRLNS